MQFVIQTLISAWVCPISSWKRKDHSSCRDHVHQKIDCPPKQQREDYSEALAMWKSRMSRGFPAISKLSKLLDSSVFTLDRKAMEKQQTNPSFCSLLSAFYFPPESFVNTSHKTFAALARKSMSEYATNP